MNNVNAKMHIDEWKKAIDRIREPKPIDLAVLETYRANSRAAESSSNRGDNKHKLTKIRDTGSRVSWKRVYSRV